MRKLLVLIKVIQVVSNEERNANGLKRLGKGHFNAYRLNPYNPLSYITLVIGMAIGIILFGFAGIRKEIDANPFKWN